MDSASQLAEEAKNSGDDQSFQTTSSSSNTTKTADNPSELSIITETREQVDSTPFTQHDENQNSSQEINVEEKDSKKDENATSTDDNSTHQPIQLHHQQHQQRHHVQEENSQQMYPSETEIKSRNDKQDLASLPPQAAGATVEPAKVDTTQAIEQNNNSNSNSHKMSCPPEEIIAMRYEQIAPAISTALLIGSETSKSSPTATTTTEIKNSAQEATDDPQIANERLQAAVVSSASSENEAIKKTTHEPSSTSTTMGRESEVKQTIHTNEVIKECASSQSIHERQPTQVNDCSESNGDPTSCLESNSSLDSERYEKPFAEMPNVAIESDTTKVIKVSNENEMMITVQGSSSTDMTSTVTSELCNYPDKEALIEIKFDVKSTEQPQKQQQNNCTSSSSSRDMIVRNETESRAPKIDFVDSSSISTIQIQKAPATATTTTSNQPTKSLRIVGPSTTLNDDEIMSSSTERRRGSLNEIVSTISVDLNKTNTQEVPGKSVEYKRSEMGVVSSSNYPMAKSNNVESMRPTFTVESPNETRPSSESYENKQQTKIVNYQTSNQALVASTIRHLFQQSALEDTKSEKHPPNHQDTVSSNRVMPPSNYTNSHTSRPSHGRELNHLHYGSNDKVVQKQPQQPPPPRQQNKYFPEFRSAETINSSSSSSASSYSHSKDMAERWNNQPQQPSNSTTSYQDTMSGLSTTSNLENVPRIPAMVDTVLAMKKTKPDPERRYSAIQQVDSNQIDYAQHQPQHPQRNYYNLPAPSTAPNMKTSSMYVSNPDFTKQQPIMPQQHQPPPTSHHHQNNDLSQLHMKPPDFSKVKEVKAKTEPQKYAPPSITQQNFAEMSKKYNYVKDLRLKNPPPQDDPGMDRNAYNTLYMKAPNFSMQKFQAKPSEQPISSIKVNSNSVTKPDVDNPYVRKYPQLSDDVVMSVVPTKTANLSAHERKRNEYYEYQNYQNRQQLPLSYPNTVQLQHREYSSPSNQPHLVHQDSKMTEQQQNAHIYAQKAQQLDSKLTEQQQNAHIYSQKTQQLAPSNPNYPRHSYPNNSYPTQQPQPNSATTSVIQSNRTKERALEYPQPKPQERPIPSPNYYQHHQQQSSPHQSSSTYKNSSPSPVMSTRQYPTQSSIIQQVPSPVSVQSSSSKPIQSPGAMNPPYGWPSQSPNSRAGQSPVASPHTPYRITQSPVGVNAPSPHSPSFLQPSPKPSPSPTHIPRPTPQTVNVTVSYKNPYMYHQQSDTLRDCRNPTTAYIPKTEKLPTDRPYPEETMPMYRHDEQQGEYSLPQKLPPPTRHLENIELARRNDSLKNSQRNAHSTESLNKSSTSHSKVVEKPNYREMINHAFAMRNATSEDDLNYEIIKRTLNKDISVRRSENDLSKNIFDSPIPTKNTMSHHYPRPNEIYNNSRVVDPYAKYGNHHDYSSKMYLPNNTTSSTNSASVKAAVKTLSLPICNDITRNDISVTVSKVVKQPSERPRPVEKELLPVPRTSYLDSKDLSNVVISKMKADSLPEQSTSFSSRTRPPEPPPSVQKPSSSVFLGGPVKRESPLDLSVKTVKTKADSTGCDDSNNYQARNNVTSNTLKVDFAPNFSKHVRTPSLQPPQAVQPQTNYEPQHHQFLPSTSRQYTQQSHQQSVTQPQNAAYSHHHKSIPAAASSYASDHHRPVQQSTAPYQPGPYNQQRDQKMFQTAPPNPNVQSQDRSQLIPRPSPSASTSLLAQQYKPKLPDERLKIMEANQSRKVEVLPPKQSHYQDYHRPQSSSHQYGRVPVEIPPPMQSSYNDQRYMDSAKYKQPFPPTTNHNAALERARNEEEYARRVEIMKNQQAVAAQQNRINALPEHYSKHKEVPIVQKRIEEVKPIPPIDTRNNQLVDHYNRKRPLDTSNASGSQYHPPEKQVRVDDLYRAHLAQNHYAQQQQQQQAYHVQTSTPNSYDRRDIPVLRKDGQHLPQHPPYPGHQQHVGHAQHAAGQAMHSGPVVQPGQLARHIVPSHPGHSPHPSQGSHVSPTPHPSQSSHVSSLVHPAQPTHISQTIPSGQSSQSRYPVQAVQSSHPGQLHHPGQLPHPGAGLHASQPPQLLPHSSHPTHSQYNSHSTHASQSPHPSRNPAVEQYMQYKENYMHPKYPPANNVAPYQNTAVRAREQPPVPQPNQTWYPPIQHEEKREKDLSGYSQGQYNTSFPSSFTGEHMPAQSVPERVNNVRSVIQQNELSQKPPQHAPQTPGNNNTLRGADQNVIDKLRTSIEMREHEKQKLLNRKQMNGEMAEDETTKPDIASLIAARIRTKGELKGYNPVPPVQEKSPSQEEIVDKVVPEEPKPPQVEPCLEYMEPGSSAFDLMDWGSTCNDFVEQLQTGTRKKGGKKRKTQKGSNESCEELLDKIKVNESLPGVAYNGDIDQSIVAKIKSEAMEATVQPKNLDEIKKDKPSSSDEDKPLLLLRQKSQTDLGLVSVEKEPKTQSLPNETMKSQESEGSSTMRSQHSSLTDTNSIARTAREKLRMEQEKRLAARLSKTSSSESDDELKRSMQRPKKLTRKPRSKASGASAREASDTDSSVVEDKSMTRNLFRSRFESRKRKFIEKVSSSSESRSNKKITSNTVGNAERIIKLPIAITPSSVVLKREIITKAQIKCMKLASEKSESSEDNDDDEKKSKSITDVKNSIENNTKDGSGTESNTNHDQRSDTTAKHPRPYNRKSKLLDSAKPEETMTRSKRKKELEQRLANSKVLRNDKIIQNTPIRKGKIVDKTPTRTTRSNDPKSSEEKFKPQISTRSSKGDKLEESKRKLCGNDSDDKVKRKQSKLLKDDSSSSSRESSDDSGPKTVSERLRLRRSRHSNESTPIEKMTELRKTRSSDRAKVENEKKPLTPVKGAMALKKIVTPIKQKPVEPETNTAKFPPGWELEVYQYKRSLKVPQSLITIKGPAHHRVSTSLPDLDPPSSDASESFPTDLKSNASKDLKENQQTIQKGCMKKLKVITDESLHEKFQPQSAKSIIDILHQRVPISRRQFKKNGRHLIRSELRLLPRGTNQTELLATPHVKANSLYRSEHHQIREIFGGEDRPASAPPELIDSKEEHESKMTFDKKYEQYMTAMNDVDFGCKIRKNKKGVGVGGLCEEIIKRNILQFPIKKEKLDEFTMNHEDEETQDTEINACLLNAVTIKDETQDTNERDTPSIISERDGVVTPLLFKRKKNNKIRSTRRKGSSGFDYIRKKKKPTQNTNNGHETVKKKRISPVELLHSRDESDVSKEIQRWVLNKGVGQSALHKAARLGYLDVIAFCLERMGLNPDPKDNAGYTPLHEACSKGRIDIARLLLQYGANHSETAASGIRPLHEASENGSVEIVRLLLSYGADPLLTTYSGQTPLMLADNNEMEQFIKNHLHDVQNTGPHKQPWKFSGPWSIYDPDICGFDGLAGAPDIDDDYDEMDESLASKNTTNPEIKIEDMSTPPELKDKCDTNSNSILSYEEKRIRHESITTMATPDKTCLRDKFKTVSNCTVVLDSIESIERINSVKQFNDYESKNVQRRRSTVERKEIKTENEDESSEGDGDLFEFEEADVPLPPLYLLKDEGAEKWVLLSDLCSLLKVKSKDTLLKQISPSLPPPTNKELLRELKMADFLEKATCLQLLCAGEKLKIQTSKVVLVKYNESVRNLLGVKTIVMKF